ncbi:Uncharacterized protein TCAP_07365 [Tolypocladium capitatum]|uniref:2EXR domain-containing protein n=1 Tax=Tolypocladium capitatum TaxID=45235 RepID=A0A2K3PZ43_9HYPO|nr:Uncharacterized protein TCAP_07365 [Tolypocladium capitatum]
MASTGTSGSLPSTDQTTRTTTTTTTTTTGQSCARSSRLSKFTLLPAELRLKIWACAVEPRVIILDDLVQTTRSYPMPPVTQLNAEARSESRQGYEAAGRGSHLHFARDILVCDPNISDQKSNKPLEALAPRVRRLAFWDCFPDDGRVDGLYHYSAYLAACYPQESLGKVELDKVWFPNLKDLWIIKVGDVDRSWKVAMDRSMPYAARARKTARQFRYWVDDNVVEIAPLDLDEPETKVVLRQGRCGKVDCRELNRGRPKMVSKVMFMDGRYDERDAEAHGWKRIWPWSTAVEQGTERDSSENKMRWIMVERILTFSLRWEGSGEAEEASSTRRRVQDDAGGGRRRVATEP